MTNNYLDQYSNYSVIGIGTHFFRKLKKKIAQNQVKSELIGRYQKMKIVPWAFLTATFLFEMVCSVATAASKPSTDL